MSPRTPSSSESRRLGPSRGVGCAGLIRSWARWAGVLAVAAFLEGTVAHGASDNWKSTTSGALWGTYSNWSTGVVPGSGTNVTFTDASNLALGISLSKGSATANTLTFSGTDTFTFDNTNMFTIGAGGIINSESGRTQTFNNAFTVSASQTWSATSGGLAFNGAVGLGSSALTVAGSNAVGITGAITGAAASSVTKSGTGTLTLGAANPSFLGSFAVNAGILQTNVSGALSGNKVTIGTGGTLNLNGTSQSVATFASTGALNLGSSGTFTLLGSASLAGTLSGTGTLILNSGSTLTLGANFNASGINIQLNGGTLKLNGKTDTFGSLTITANSIVDFANPSTSVLSVNGVTLSGTSQLSVQNWANMVDYFYSSSNPGTEGTAPEDQIVFSGDPGSLTHWNSVTTGPGPGHEITPTPESPAYGALFVGLAIVGLFVARNRRHLEHADLG